MNPIRNAEAAGACRERVYHLTASADREVQGRVATREERERVDQMMVPLHRIEIADGHHKTIVRCES